VREKQVHSQKATSSADNSEGKASFLAHSDIFQQLKPDEISELERSITVITCPPGRIFYRPGEAGISFFLLRTGRVQIYHLSTDGRKLITATLGPGACFGELPLIGQRIHNSFAEAIEDARIYAMSRHDAEQLLTRRPAVALALLRVVGQRLAELETQLVNTTFKGTSARLATLLLQLAAPQDNSSNALVVDGLSHEELADRLGVYRETVSAVLRELKDTGAIELGRKHITISNPSLLANLASSGGKGGRP
jgi:CRP-like cAMP-binding protein